MNDEPTTPIDPTAVPEPVAVAGSDLPLADTAPTAESPAEPALAAADAAEVPPEELPEEPAADEAAAAPAPEAASPPPPVRPGRARRHDFKLMAEDVEQLRILKSRLQVGKTSVRKSDLVRAAIHLLAGRADEEVRAAVDRLTPEKRQGSGRSAKKKR